ncbi:uncharacterized protein LOC120686439 isoform X2 [Panicum virgatum]|uniref:uncharacterized protein LOC120686439 isoform X2 n=1 Tax=Panicum virgatum TaxID=38727 RepID=UPI0019D4FDF2|nr:uncharacterized protein LOC120686439 isoform X2 [Panicum virgatum]
MYTLPMAERFDAQSLMEMSKSSPVVLLFLGVTSNTFDGHLTLQCSATYMWYVNLELPETALLHQSFGSAVGQAYWIGEEHHNQPQITTVAELSAIENPHEAEGNKYKVTARIKELVPNQQWWYLACNKCKRTTRPNGDSYRCYDSTCIGTDAIPRYKIPFLAIDPEAAAGIEEKTIEMICFGAVADEMVGLTADNLVSLSTDVQGYIPEQIKRMYGARYDFDLSVPRGAVRFGKTTFRIDSFTRIAELEEQATAEVPPLATTTASEVIKPHAVSVHSSQSDLATRNASTPVKDALDRPALQTPITPALPKEKRPIAVTNTEAGLEDSDCETRSRAMVALEKKMLASRQPSKIRSAMAFLGSGQANAMWTTRAAPRHTLKLSCMPLF